MTCLHLKLSKLADTMFEPFPSFAKGFRYYKCEECGAMLKAKETVAHPVELSPMNTQGRCPKCGSGPIVSTSHGPYCPKDTCKWGWETEMDGSPLKPPVGHSAPPAEPATAQPEGPEPTAAWWQAQYNSVLAYAAHEHKLRLAAEQEVLRLKLQYCVAECWWDDNADRQWDSAEEFAIEQDLKVGDTFKLVASTYWNEEFRVTKVPDPPEIEDGNDDYECEEISRKREEFPAYSELKAKLESAEARLAQIEKAVRWALGEVDDFRAREDGEGAYWWRTELRKRAGLSADSKGL